MIKIIPKEGKEYSIYIHRYEFDYFSNLEYNEYWDEYELFEIEIFYLHKTIEFMHNQFDCYHFNTKQLYRLIYIADYLGYKEMYNKACVCVSMKILECTDLEEMKHLSGMNLRYIKLNDVLRIG